MNSPWNLLTKQVWFMDGFHAWFRLTGLGGYLLWEYVSNQYPCFKAIHAVAITIPCEKKRAQANLLHFLNVHIGDFSYPNTPNILMFLLRTWCGYENVWYFVWEQNRESISLICWVQIGSLNGCNFFRVYKLFLLFHRQESHFMFMVWCIPFWVFQ